MTFYGVRGSTPCPAGPQARYGGNTSCVVVDGDDGHPIVLDLGTGVREWGKTQSQDGHFHATALVTHFHFDHIQGLPFLTAADRVGAKLDIYGPGDTGKTTAELFAGFVRPPLFPVGLDQLRGSYTCHDVWNDDFAVGDAKVRVRPVPHVGETVGYRVEMGGRSVAYVSDHQAPNDMDSVDAGVLDLCDGVDLLIHDAQYCAADWETKAHWGHSTYDYALHVAVRSGAKALALFHHDPARSDIEIDDQTAAIRARARSRGVEVFAAAEGLSVVPGESMDTQRAHRVVVGPMFRAH